MMVPMCFSLTNLKQVGTSFQIEVSIQSLILFMVNTILSMCIIITYIPMLMRNQELREERKVLLMDNFYLLVSSHLRTNGSEELEIDLHSFYLNK